MILSSLGTLLKTLCCVRARYGAMGDAWLVVAVATLGMVVYLNTLGGGFAYDDKVAVLTNRDVVGNSSLWDVWRHDFWGNNMMHLEAGEWTHHSYRPLVVLSFRLQHFLHGMDPMPFHLANVLLHGACCGLATALCLHLGDRGHHHDAASAAAAATDEGANSPVEHTRRPPPQTYQGSCTLCAQQWVTGAVAAVLFAVHPVHTEVVANITGRAETAGACFALASLLCYLRAQRRGAQGHPFTSLGWVGGAAGCMAAGVLCKETVLVLPALWLVLEVVDWLRESLRGPGVGTRVVTQHHQPWWLPWSRAVAAVGLGGVLLVGRVAWLDGGYQLDFHGLENVISMHPSTWARALSYTYVQARALLLLVWPVNLAHDHSPIEPVQSATDARVWLVVLFWLGILLLLRWYWRQRRPSSKGGRDRSAAWRGVLVVLFGLALVAIPYAPASHVLVTVAFLIAERTLFLPSLGACIILAHHMAAWAYPNTDGAPRARDGHQMRRDSAACAPSAASSAAPHPGRARLLAVTAVIAVLLATRTWSRNADWRDDASLLRASGALYPLSATGLYGRGVEAAKQGDLEHAEAFLVRSVLAYNRFPDALIGLGDIAASKGDMQRAGRMYQLATRRGGRTEFASNVYLIARQLGGGVLGLTTAEAELEGLSAHYSGRAIAAGNHHRAQAALNAGCIRLTSQEYGHLGEALALFRQAASLHNEPWYGMYNQALVAASQGEYASALATVAKAASLASGAGRPDRVEIYSGAVRRLQEATAGRLASTTVLGLDIQPAARLHQLGLACECFLLRLVV